MDEKVRTFIDELLKQLAGLPEDEIKEAAGFYEEYFSEALDAGKDIDSVISEMGTPAKIAAVIKAETSIAKARKDPGIRNFNSAFTSAFGLVKAPVSVFWLSVTALISYSMVAILFGGAFAVGLAAVVVFFGMAYEALGIPLRFFPSMIGALGLGLFSAGICSFTAYYLFRLGKLFIMFSTNLVRMMLKLSGRKVSAPAGKGTAKRSKWRPVPILFAAIAAGFILTAVSGLPLTYFTIFNSMKPTETESISYEYSPKDISRVIIHSANSKISVDRSRDEKIKILYNQPVWFSHDVANKGGILEFNEKSSGMLPLFQLTTMHEGMCEITVMLPKDFDPDSVTLESTGGHINIDGLYGNTTVNTSDGNITLNTSGAYRPFDINAETFNGILLIGEKKFYKQQNVGPVYKQKGTSGKWINIKSFGGNVTIK